MLAGTCVRKGCRRAVRVLFESRLIESVSDTGGKECPGKPRRRDRQRRAPTACARSPSSGWPSAGAATATSAPPGSASSGTTGGAASAARTAPPSLSPGPTAELVVAAGNRVSSSLLGCHRSPRRGRKGSRAGSYWYHGATGAYFDDRRPYRAAVKLCLKPPPPRPVSQGAVAVSHGAPSSQPAAGADAIPDAPPRAPPAEGCLRLVSNLLVAS